MKLNTLGNTGIKVTEVGFGALTIGPWQLNLKIDEGAEIIAYAINKGINFIDTAEYYKTYEYIKKALQLTNKEIVLCNKSLVGSYDGMKKAVLESQIALDKDVIDIFLLHEVRNGSDFIDRSGAWEYLNEAKCKGIVKAIGISTHHVDVAAEASLVKEIDILFPIINYKSLGIRNGDFPGNKEDMLESIKLNKAENKGIFAMKVFGGGNLSSSYIEALDYVKSIPDFDSMMIGFSNTREIDEIFDYCDGKLSKDFVASNSLKKIRVDHGDCISCGKCITRCPNSAIFSDENGQAEINHTNCLTCGYCAPVCPVFAIIMF